VIGQARAFFRGSLEWMTLANLGQHPVELLAAALPRAASSCSWRTRSQATATASEMVVFKCLASLRAAFSARELAIVII
jgi:hypothetical protein